jgi:excisionase family DNA binding protein
LAASHTAIPNDEFIAMPHAIARITVDEIAERLALGRLAVYALLESGAIPAIRLGRQWIITRYAYENWEHNCGQKALSSNHGSTQTQV